MTRENYPAELKVFKDITLPDSFSEKNFSRWQGYINRDIYDIDDLKQIEEFVFPRCFSEESVGLLNDYCIRGKKALKRLDKNSLLEFFKLVDYLEMPALEGDCVIPFLENILKNGQSELSKTELKEIENSAIIGAYTKTIKTLCAEIKKCKDKYNTSGFPEELADLDLKMKKIIKEINCNFFVLLYLGILPLYPLLLQTVSPLSRLIFEQSLINPGSMGHLVGLRYLFDIWKMIAMWLNVGVLPIVLSVLSDKPIPKTTAIFKKIAYAIYTIAKHILYAPIFVGKETGKAILFTAKTLSKIPSIVHSRLKPLISY